MHIKMIWFDFGGVLSPPIPELFESYRLKTGLQRVQLEAAWDEVARPFNMHGLAPIELGMLSQRDWGNRVSQALTALYPDIDVSRCDFDNYGDQWFAQLSPNRLMIDLLARAKRHGFQVGILTNNIVEWEKPWRTMLDIDHLVDQIVDSCKVGVRKPQPEIFVLAAERARAEPRECVLIDDVAENCDAARSAGWHAIFFQDNPQAERNLLELTGPLAA